MFESLREKWGKLSEAREKIRGLRDKVLLNPHDSQAKKELEQALAREQEILEKVIKGD